MGIVWALVIVVAGFLLGFVFQKLKPSYSRQTSIYFSKFSLFFLIPFSVLSSLWQLPNITAQLVYLPLIGAAVIGVGIASGFICRRIFHLNNHQFGALLPVTAFYNLGALGNLIVFVTIGENGIALLALFKLCEELIYFGWAFPFSRSLGQTKTTPDASRKPFWKDPIFVIALSAVIFGLVLNQNGVPRPQVFANLIGMTVPLSSFMMIIAVGMTFNVAGGRQWVKLGVVSTSIRSLASVALVAGLLTSLGLWGVNGGDLARVCLLLAVMPTAFMSVLPAVLYDLDQSLANTTWLTSFLISLITIPIVIYVTSLIGV